MTQARGFVVQKTMCSTCIYRKDSPLDLEHLEDQVRDKYGGFEKHRQCHHSNVTKDLLDRFIAAGFKMAGANDGGDKLRTDDTTEMASFLTGVDESRVSVAKGDESFSIFIVLGNDLSEIVCDHSVNTSVEYAEFNAVVRTHYEDWEAKANA